MGDSVYTVQNSESRLFDLRSKTGNPPPNRRQELAREDRLWVPGPTTKSWLSPTGFQTKRRKRQYIFKQKVESWSFVQLRNLTLYEIRSRDKYIPLPGKTVIRSFRDTHRDGTIVDFCVHPPGRPRQKDLKNLTKPCRFQSCRVDLNFRCREPSYRRLLIKDRFTLHNIKGFQRSFIYIFIKLFLFTFRCLIYTHKHGN